MSLQQGVPGSVIAEGPRSTIPSISDLPLPTPSPAIRAFLRELGDGRDFGQVHVHPVSIGFELRHREDRGRDPDTLRAVPVGDLRTLTRYSASGAFRPLKGAPNLVSDWRCVATSDRELESALGHLYPGALADWTAVRHPPVRVGTFREFMGRQTGIYRGVRHLDNVAAGLVIRSGCHQRYCLKRRWWTVDGLEPDAAELKSDLPCLEPCAILLDWARRVAGLEKEEKFRFELSRGEIGTLLLALDLAAALPPGPDVREGDTSIPGHPRRFQLLLERFRRQFPAQSVADDERAGKVPPDSPNAGLPTPV